MTIADIIAAAAHSGRIATVTIQADDPADCDRRFGQIAPLAGTEAYTPDWHTSSTHRWYGGWAFVDGTIVGVSTPHERIEQEQAA